MPADDGDDAARFTRAYGCSPEQVLDWLLHNGYRITHGNRNAAEDLAQDTFERLLKATPTVVPSAPKAYILRIQTNLFIDQRRRNKAVRRGNDNRSHPLHEAPEPVVLMPGPEALALMEETRISVLEAIKKLPQREQEVVELALDYLSMGLDYRTRDEIARILKIPTGTVRSRLHNAIRNLRKLIQRPGGDIPGEDAPEKGENNDRRSRRDRL
ncbi:MAG: RNA polymerase sigma factor [Pseudonocardiaceae bacterium]